MFFELTSFIIEKHLGEFILAVLKLYAKTNN